MTILWVGLYISGGIQYNEKNKGVNAMSEFDINEDLEQPFDEAPARPVTRRKKKKSSILYYAMITICLGVFIFCAIYIADYFSNAIQTENGYGHLSELVHGAQSGSKDPDNNSFVNGSISMGGKPGIQDESKILEKYQVVYAKNNDLVGWMNIPGTSVDYPVVQSPGNKDFYLKHDFYGNPNNAGCLYVREACDVFKPSDNVVVYGHHMTYGGMFATLDRYTKKSFWEEHQTFNFDTIYEEHTYQVIAVFKTSANLGEGFAYHIFNDANSEEEFNQFIQTVHSLQMYDTGLTAEYGDMLLTLSTCEETLDNGRFVVVAKRIS